MHDHSDSRDNSSTQKLDNNSNSTSFVRCPHDKENPYAQINRSLIRDNSISPECRWMLIYMLSHRDDWVIKMAELQSHLKGLVGRDKIYKMINEAIEAGYMRRQIFKERNLQRSVYYVSESKNLKKYFPPPENQEVGGKKTQPDENKQLKKSFRSPDSPDSGETHHKEDYSNTLINNNSPLDNSKKKDCVSELSSGLCHFFYEKLKEINPKIQEPNLKKWTIEMDRILRLDKRSDKELRQVIEFIIAQHKNPTREFTWSTAVKSPEKLREHFASIWAEINKPLPEKKRKELEEKERLARHEGREANKQWVRDFCAKYKAPILEKEISIFPGDRTASISYGNIKHEIDLAHHDFKDKFKTIIKNLK
jgi:hypothetical protein